MIELPLVFMTGVLGSSHCIGMCGGFVLSIGGSSPSVRTNLSRQAVYSLGRIFTYASLGAVAGFGGLRLASSASGRFNIPSILAGVAGALLIYQGLVGVGIIKRRGVSGAGGPCLGASMFASLLTTPGVLPAFLAGLFTGLLPCGLLYGMLTLAASTQDTLWGMVVMALFGLGTAPVMMLTGCSGSILGLVARRRLLYWAAWCVVLTGTLTIARGFGVTLPGLWNGPKCPICG